MLQVDDIRKTRVYREAQEEARVEERQRSREEKIQSIKKMADKMVPPEDIADFLNLEIEVVLKELANGST